MSSKYFTQEGPRIGNQYDEDAVLQGFLKRKLPSEVLRSIEPDLQRFGDRVMKDVLEWGNEVENQRPQLVQYDAWGNRIDEIVVCNGWNQLKKVSAEEGLIAIAYERKFKEYSRIYQFTKLYLFGPSSSIFTCPLAMTDGAARLIELNGNDKQKQGPYKHLTSRDPVEFWTSGQWMTEKTGGSDVGNSETIAVPSQDNNYLISGYKFFTSASTSEMTILLARAKDENNNFIKGSKGLSTFYLEMRRKEDNKLNNLTVHKLKNKVGTKGLPTAEIELTNSVGQLIGNKHQGIKVISTILNITRIHNAVSCVSTMRRAIAVATNYANKRTAFGKLLKDQPLHIQTLSDIQLEFQSAFYFLFHTIHLLGKIECSNATKEEEILFRLLTPLLKLYTAKQAVSVTSECLEALGGTGYMEDEPYSLAKLWRDVQVCPIWEGTTNVLSLDVWRPLKSEGAYDIFVKDVSTRINATSSSQNLANLVNAVKKALEELTQYINKCMQSMDKNYIESTARHFAFSLSRVYMASLLIEQAHASKNETDAELANRWCFRQNLTPVSQLDSNLQLSSKIAFSKL